MMSFISYKHKSGFCFWNVKQSLNSNLFSVFHNLEQMRCCGNNMQFAKAWLNFDKTDIIGNAGEIVTMAMVEQGEHIKVA